MYVNSSPKGETESASLHHPHGSTPHGAQWGTLRCQPSGPATDPDSHSREVLVAHDGRGLPSHSEGMPLLPSVRGRSAKGSPLPDSSICSAGACAPQLHQHRVHDGAE